MNPVVAPAAAVVPDDAQLAVVGLPPEASGVVVGAPGTGKTLTLVERVRSLVEQGVAVDDILVITPSRQTATSLRDRLALAVGRATSGSLARSIASFAFQLVRAAAVARGDEPPQLLTGGDEDQILQDLLDGDASDDLSGEGRGWPEWLPAPIRGTHGFRAELRAFAAECTTLGIPPERLAALGSALGVPAWGAAASFLREYADVLARMRGAHRDAAGLVREAVGLVADATVLPGIVLVDDAQELTLGGVELLEACAARGVAVLAFGDPDVGAGAFRGARPENFARLAARFGLTAVLSDVHRGTALQRDVVRSLTQRIGAVGVVAHRRPPEGAEPDGSLRALLVRSSAEEYDAIARILRARHVEDGVPWARCAVVAHDSRQVTALEAELAAREVPARASGPGLALGALRPVRDLLHLVDLAMRSAAEWSHEDAEDALLGVCGALDPIALRRLRSALRLTELASTAAEVGGDRGDAPPAAERSGRDLLLSAMRTPLEFDLIDTREARRAHRVATTVARLRDALAERATAHELLWIAWDSSRLERAWSEAAKGNGPLAERANRDLDAVVSLFQAAKRSVERDVDADPRAFVRGILDSDVAEDRLDAVVPESAVRVLTPAGALGTEFDTVVVAGVQDGVWPNTRLRGSLLDTWRLADAADGAVSVPAVLDRRRAAMHDELRLFVRAVSRASRRVVVTAVDDDDTGPSVLFEFLPDPERPTREMEHPLSLRGAVARHRRTLTDPARSAAAERHAAGQLAVLARARVAGADPEQWYGVRPLTSTAPLRDLAQEDVRVSPSRLDTLAECELNWVIGDLGGDPGGATAGLGTIVHAALEHAAADEEALWAAVDARWGELVFEAPWRERAERARARDLVRRLALYLRTFERGGGVLIGAEPHFEIPVALDDAPAEHGVVLSGYIDRVERSSDGAVVIVDLKTGKREPQTDAAVLDNAQLAAYQLAFETGAIAEAAGLPAGGAKLLVLRPSAKSKEFVEPWQPPFDDERRAAFLDRIVRSARVMSGTSFLAPYEEHCRDEFGYGLCRIHTVGPVSAS